MMRERASLPDAHSTAAKRELEMVEFILNARKTRSAFFDADMFFDPAWAILLDLYRCKLIGVKVSVSDACLASDVPESTALRYLKMMEKRGLLSRTPDPADKRRMWLSLSSAGCEALSRFLRQIAQLNPAAVTQRV
ncbi:MAG: hypothetical protein CVT76_05640 [Alphaproteobacteria bacterium HGW-Alphaproteobacteria-15]|nr:MAG: hypothetical protein CVT76_05640 [Alphaproteobacteria bacterium HGW-Alphaproteobacteria-15]